MSTGQGPLRAEPRPEVRVPATAPSPEDAVEGRAGRSTAASALGPAAAAARLVALALGCLALARAGLLLAHPDAFAALSWAQVWGAFVLGLRFDLAALAPLLGVPVALFVLPVPGHHGPRWRAAWGWLAFAPLPPATALLAADLLYFGEVRRHLGREPLLLGNDLEFVGAMALVHAPVLATWATLALALLLAWRRALARPVTPARRPWLVAGVVAGLVVLAWRGSLDRKPLNPADAFRGRVPAHGHLLLNGLFTVQRAALSGARERASPLSARAALEALALDPEAPYPVVRRGPGGASAPPGNVVLVLLESWDTRYMGAYGGARAALTPRFDAWATRGRLFEQVFAASQRTVGGVQAALTGVPCLPGVPELGRGLEQTAVTRVAALARARGYRTFFLQAPRRRSFYLDSVMLSLGFEAAYGLEDVAPRRVYPDPDPKWGWDHDAFQEALARIDALGDAPFLAVLLSGTSHGPYADPGPEFHVAPHGRHDEGGYRNTLAYSDWALGELLEGARARPWFERTTFLIGADHVFRSSSADLAEGHRIPFLALGPGIAPGRDAGVRSQLDVLPTLVERLGLADAPVATVGRSLLGPASGEAVVHQGDLVGLITGEGWLLHTIDAGVADRSAGLSADALARLERRLLATYAVTTDLVERNRWAPPDGR